ncbi:GlxA family transcriptional regulator [Roseovarius spongiae]|uniref:GlxA family transcriptional regulator n=1 Tax=Roseovarius spongiae TaxID=2320272 RepID=A0A3A8AWQ2_9RHOB|nr:GlxA family transcriptional regulator [Roseovarius spongiae]RKF16803.1 GlxA family transcriptional regulator [Roseovarius spongiae]
MSHPAPAPTRLVHVLLPRFNMLALNGLREPARIANYLSPAPRYHSSLHAADGPRIIASNGTELPCAPLPERLDRHDIIFVSGSWGSEHYRNPALFSWLRLQARAGLRICAVDVGAYILARAGLLSGRLATLHWSYLPGFQEEFPDIDVVEQLFTQDGAMMTCSGGTAGIDLMLTLIQNTHGTPLAGEVSDQMMHHPVRPDHARQRVTLGRGTSELPGPVRATVDLIARNISEPLKVPEIARRVGLSQRQLIREFSKVMGCSVVQFALLMRLQHARVLLVTTDLSIRDVSAASGFNSLAHFAYSFKKCFGKRPSDYRQAWPADEAEPHWPGTLSSLLDSMAVDERAP